MKAVNRIIFLALPALFICCANTPTKKADNVSEKDNATSVAASEVNTHADVRSFGLLGNVKDVTVTVSEISSEGDVTTWEDSTQYMKFDGNGRVLKDRYDNLYQYDDQGNFIFGLTEKSKMKRDGNGRIVFYENRMDEEDDMGFTMNFEYDENDRIAKVTTVGWESTFEQTFTYNDDHVYPDRVNLESEDEGDHYSTVMTYTYKQFDSNGNWTEREINTVSKHTIEDEPEVETNEFKSIEKRVIRYY